MATIKIKTNNKIANHDIKVGEFLSEYLASDTRVYEVIKTTAKSVTLRSTSAGKIMESDFPIQYNEAVSNTNGNLKTLRVRQDGTLRSRTNSHPISPARIIDSNPVSQINYSM